MDGRGSNCCLFLVILHRYSGHSAVFVNIRANEVKRSRVTRFTRILTKFDPSACRVHPVGRSPSGMASNPRGNAARVPADCTRRTGGEYLGMFM